MLKFFKLLFLNSEQSEKGAVLPAAVVAAISVGLLTTYLYKTQEINLDTSKLVFERDQMEIAVEKITHLFRSSAVCTRNFGGVTLTTPGTIVPVEHPTTVAETGSLTEIYTTSDASRTFINVCTTGIPAKFSQAERECSVGYNTPGHSVLTSVTISNYQGEVDIDGDDEIDLPDDEMTRTGRLNFTFYRRTLGDDTGTTRFGSNRAETLIKTNVSKKIRFIVDGANSIVSCVVDADDSFSNLCASINGTISYETDGFCKNIMPRQPGNTTATVRGNRLNASVNAAGHAQIHGDLQILNAADGDGAYIGKGGAVPDPAAMETNSTNGGLIVTGGIQTRELNVGTNGPTPGGDVDNDEPGTMEIGHSLWIGTTARPGMSQGDLELEDDTDIRARYIYLPNLVETDSIANQNQIVTQQWVQRKLAIALTPDLFNSGAEIDQLVDALKTQALSGADTTAEARINRYVCDIMRLGGNLAANDGTKITATYSGVSDNTCTFTLNNNNIRCNSPGNCATVYGNQLCLRHIEDGSLDCRSSWPSGRTAIRCISSAYSKHFANPSATSSPAPGSNNSYASDPYPEGTGVSAYNMCPGDRILRGGSCCTDRVN